MAMIDGDIDRYGSLVRSSCLADFLEVVALKGLSYTFAQLEDRVEDDWPRKRQIYNMPDDDPSDDDESYADGVKSCISERIAILGDRYPFERDQFGIKLREGVSVHASPYIALLGVTIVHAYRLNPDLYVDRLFEGMVASALDRLGLTVGNVGALSRANRGNFEQTMRALSSQVNILMDPNAAVRHIAANDGGIDIFAHIDLKDTRTGRWTILGQVTCGSSDTWSSKVGEPHPPTWRLFMAETAKPRVFLAVPHHVEHRAFRDISEGTGHTLLDRIRLTAYMDTVPTSVVDVIDTVMGATVHSVKV